MKKILMEAAAGSGEVSLETLLLNLVIALLLSVIVFIAYRFSYSGTAFSKKFMVSLGMMTLITTIIMNVISNNIALSLGMVGALSIIRFRTAVKDVRDTTFIFWCIGIGICCGVSMYMQAIAGSLFLLVFLLAMGQIKGDNTYLIVIKTDEIIQDKVTTFMDGYFKKKAHLRVRNKTQNAGSLIYETTYREVQKARENKAEDFVDVLLEMTGVRSVDLVKQTDDISR